MTGFGTTIAFAPLLPWLVLAGFAVAALAAIVAGLFLGARGLFWRTVAIALLWLILANPSLVIENRDPLKDVAVIVVDESPSQLIGQRKERTEAALKHVRETLERLGDIEIRVVRAGSPKQDGTELFNPLEKILADIPRKRLAGVVMITDGQIHDAPVKERMPRDIGPLHVLLSGEKNEGDRRIVIESAPNFGIMGKPLQMKILVDDNAAAPGTPARVTIKRDGVPWRTVTVPVGRSQSIDFELEHPGSTFFELEVERGTRELTLDNNRAVAAINGIRDRLRVLLISGEPHPGERSWRNLLKSDPGVDLVHFTILRPPEKRDVTPVNELSLISFPVRELFEEKLSEFDLIIFDRYRRRGVILNQYYQNIAKYLEKGGALLVASGPAFASPLSLYHSPLGEVLPSQPTGQVINQPYRALVTDKGLRHPVTADLPTSGDKDKPWGRFYRLIDVTVKNGHVLMTGAEGRPLLVLDRVGEGRVAQLLTDHAWLWGRGFDGGGPQTEIMRRLAHWLMKEPELEENRLSAEVRGDQLHVSRRTLDPNQTPATITLPNGEQKQMPLAQQPNGRATGNMEISQPGLYRITDGQRSTMVAVGSLNPKEVLDVRTTADKVALIVEVNTGSIVWLGNDGNPEVRRVDADRDVAGRNVVGPAQWIGLKRNGDYVVTGIRDVPLLIGLLALLLATLPLLAAWRREGK
ncbi:MAG: hypothetical protein AB7G15_04010 [Alphaproteobacteria bacterium]